jgi:hypothetical protein
MTFPCLCSDPLGIGEPELGKLLIGEAGTMDQTIQALAMADKIIRS